MKKVKLFLIAAVVTGALSAFTGKPTGAEYVLVGGSYIPKNTTTGFCDNGGTVCTYTLLPPEERMHQNAPFSAGDFSSDPSEQKTWVVY